MDSCVMLRRWLRSGSCIQILWLSVSAMNTRPMGSVVSWRGYRELSVVWSLTSYPPNTPHLSQRELANSVITLAADIETIPVCSYTPFGRQLSYTQLIEELSRLREYLNSFIPPISNEYLMSVFMDSWTPR